MSLKVWLRRFLGAPQLVEAPAPKNRKKRRTAEQMKAARARQAISLHKRFKASFLEDRANARKAGSKFYIWRTERDGDVCPVCAANEGRRYSWGAKMPHGHPGEAACEGNGYCRCYAEVVL